MKKRVLQSCVIAAVVILTSTPVMAMNTQGPGWTYTEVQLSMLDLEVDALGSSSWNPTSLGLRIGHFLMRDVAIEGRLAFGVGDDSARTNDTRQTTELDHLFGVYGVAHLPMHGRISPYALAGYTSARASWEVSDPFGTQSGSESKGGFSWGAGVGLKLEPQFSVNFEYIQYLKGSDYDLSAVSIGANFQF